jgi:secondary thiamine-phosphate synthase enzyme
MTVHSGLLRMETEGFGEVVDITEGVRSVLRTSEVQVGVVTVFATGSTVAVTTMEHEPGGIRDLGELLERLIPARRARAQAPGEEQREEYAHNRLNGDSNAHAHLRAAVIGPSESIPVFDGELALGTWQQIVLIDFDDRPRSRTVAVHVMS